MLGEVKEGHMLHLIFSKGQKQVKNRIFLFGPKFIAWNIGSDGKKIDDMGTLIHKIPHNK